MAGHHYLNNSHSLSPDDYDVDDETFLRNTRPRNEPSASGYAYGGGMSDLERQRQMMLDRQREIEQRTLDSSARSLGLLHDSEQIGIATAEELARQHEQLENTNKRLDEINTNLRYSQKHINGIKSVFTSLKNYISGRNEPSPKSNVSPTEPRADVPNRLQETIANTPRRTGEENYNAHPSTRLRGLGDDQGQEQVSDSRRVNALLDDNLDQMVSAITRLKGLGLQLGEEIHVQNELIDTIQDKTEAADVNVGRQNNQMYKLLGKK